MSEDVEIQEYFTLVKSVADFDQRLLTVKSWGVTLSLAGLGLGFQYRSYGLFLVAAASSLAFWTLEGVIKRHQMRHYPRMREIEVHRYMLSAAADEPFSAPRIDWSWAHAQDVLTDAPTGSAVAPQRSGGLLLFGLGSAGYLNAFSFGASR